MLVGLFNAPGLVGVVLHPDNSPVLDETLHWVIVVPLKFVTYAYPFEIAIPTGTFNAPGLVGVTVVHPDNSPVLDETLHWVMLFPNWFII